MKKVVAIFFEKNHVNGIWYSSWNTFHAPDLTIHADAVPKFF